MKAVFPAPAIPMQISTGACFAGVPAAASGAAAAAVAAAAVAAAGDGDGVAMDSCSEKDPFFDDATLHTRTRN
eukprot:m.114823 g.114823  ORF g.114823 m.114823 type:complete len:73 (+) comp16039_c3_seq2:2541-2759(+)